jgi:oligopeptide transport system substrate-binding protein
LKKLHHPPKLRSLFFALTGCSQKKEPACKQPLRINFSKGDLSSLHPHEIGSTLRGRTIAKALFEGLTRLDINGNTKLSGAKKVRISEDGKCYLFFLRDNRWSNGVKVTAFQYSSAWKKAKIEHLKLFRDIEKIEAIDEKTLSVTLIEPSLDFLTRLSNPIFFPLLSSLKETQTEFNGPFLVAIWDKGEHFCLKANPYFWNREKVFLREIDISMIQDQEKVQSLYENKTLDWIGIPLSTLTSKQKCTFLHSSNLLGYSIAPDGTIDFSYAYFQR